MVHGKLYIVVFTALSVWRAVITQKGMRWVVVALALSYLGAVIVPSITNTLSREGVIDRQIFQITWDLFTVVGYFFMTIFYINNSRDRTTLIAKIIGITLVTFLLLMQAKKKEATDVLVKTISIGEASGLSDAMMFEALRAYGKLLREEKRIAEAGKFDARVKAVVMANPARKPPNQ